MALEQALKRGPTLRRLVKAARQPGVLLRNLKFMQTGGPSSLPCVFVLGPPRSGTTLVQNILLAHSHMAGPRHETRFFFRSNFTDHFIPDMDEREYRSVVGAAQSQVGLFEGIAAHYLGRRGATRFVEKTPEHALRLGHLQQTFPRARFAFCVRDPRDGFLSALRNPRIKLHDPFDFGETWERCVRALAEANQDSITVIKYEALCAAPREQVRALMDFLELPFEERQLAPAAIADTPVSREEGHTRLARPIGRETVGAWTTGLEPTERETIERATAFGLAYLGYAGAGR